MEDRYWHIQGYESGTRFYETTVKLGYFSENQIKYLLMALAGKAGLDFDEIVGAYAKKKTKISTELLSVQKEFTRPFYSCGENPYFTARVINTSDP